jgi:hypothetical protein
MQKIAIGLAALLLIAATSKPGTAQEASAVVIPQGCVMYELAEYPGCVNYGTLSEDEARTARGHPQFVEPVQAATASQRRRRTMRGSSRSHANSWRVLIEPLAL